MFRPLDDTISVAAQIDVPAVTAAATRGITLIINNRPEGEVPDQTTGAEIEAAARRAGVDYIAIPITHAGFAADQIAAMAKALSDARGPVLAYCRSGTRSALLWALARASAGDDPAILSAKAARAGYDLSPIRAMLGTLPAQARDT